MSHPDAAVCLFALVFLFHHQFLSVEGRGWFFKISISISFSGYDTILNIILVGIFHSWNCFCRLLEVSSAGKWVHHQSGHERRKTKRCWIGYLKAVIGMLILRLAEPRQLSHRVFMLSTSAVIRLPHLAPVSSGFCRQRPPASTSLTHSTHSCVWLAPTRSPRWRSIQSLPTKMPVKRT